MAAPPQSTAHFAVSGGTVLNTRLQTWPQSSSSFTQQQQQWVLAAPEFLLSSSIKYQVLYFKHKTIKAVVVPDEAPSHSNEKELKRGGGE